MKGGNIISVIGGSWKRLVVGCALQEHNQEFTDLEKSSNVAGDVAIGEPESFCLCQHWQQGENKFAACQQMLFSTCASFF